eukprot:SAG31_NODE_1349_length_8691_cov_6.407239_7_plen_394_part_00
MADRTLQIEAAKASLLSTLRSTLLSTVSGQGLNPDLSDKNLPAQRDANETAAPANRTAPVARLPPVHRVDADALRTLSQLVLTQQQNLWQITQTGAAPSPLCAEPICFLRYAPQTKRVDYCTLADLEESFASGTTLLQVAQVLLMHFPVSPNAMYENRHSSSTCVTCINAAEGHQQLFESVFESVASDDGADDDTVLFMMTTDIVPVHAPAHAVSSGGVLKSMKTDDDLAPCAGALKESQLEFVQDYAAQQRIAVIELAANVANNALALEYFAPENMSSILTTPETEADRYYLQNTLLTGRRKPENAMKARVNLESPHLCVYTRPHFCVVPASGECATLYAVTAGIMAAVCGLDVPVSRAPAPRVRLAGGRRARVGVVALCCSILLCSSVLLF